MITSDMSLKKGEVITEWHILFDFLSKR